MSEGAIFWSAGWPCPPGRVVPGERRTTPLGGPGPEDAACSPTLRLSWAYPRSCLHADGGAACIRTVRPGLSPPLLVSVYREESAGTANKTVSCQGPWRTQGTLKGSLGLTAGGEQDTEGTRWNQLSCNRSDVLM